MTTFFRSNLKPIAVLLVLAYLCLTAPIAVIYIVAFLALARWLWRSMFTRLPEPPTPQLPECHCGCSGCVVNPRHMHSTTTRTPMIVRYSLWDVETGKLVYAGPMTKYRVEHTIWLPPDSWIRALYQQEARFAARDAMLARKRRAESEKPKPPSACQLNARQLAELSAPHVWTRDPADLPAMLDELRTTGEVKLSSNSNGAKPERPLPDDDLPD